MSIVGTQRRKYLMRTLQELFRKGRIPSLSDVLTKDPFSYDGETPSLVPTVQQLRSISDPDVFNKNLLNFIDDLDVITTEHRIQNSEIGRELFLSDLEMRKLLGDIKNLKQKAAELIVNNDFARGIGVYASDDFSSLRYIDMVRTTALVDIDTTTVQLPVRFHEKIDLDYLIEEESPLHFNISGGDTETYIIDGSKFGNLFDEGMSSWIVNVNVEKESPRLTISFEIDLGNPRSLDVSHRVGQEFNRLSMTTQMKDASLELSYKNGMTSGFEPLPISSIVKSGDKIDYDITLSRIAGWNETEQSLRYKTSHIRRLKITMSRNTPDIIVGSQATYRFVFSDLSLFRTVYRNRAEMISRSIPINREFPTISKGALAVFDRKPTLTSLDYFVAEDKYLPAYFVSRNLHYRRPGSPDITGIYVDTDWLNPESSGIRQSELRDWAEGVGGYTDLNLSADDWAEWDPSWIKMNVINEGAALDETDVGPRVVSFGNIDQVDSRKTEAQPIWPDASGGASASIGGIDFFRVADTYDRIIEPTLVVRQGKDSWIKKRRTILSLRDSVGTGPLDGDLGSPTITAPGVVVAGSVRNVRTPTAPTEQFYDGSGPNPDYFVEYSGNNIVMKRNIGKGGDIVNLSEDDINFRYTYKEPVDVGIWESFFFLTEGEKGGLNINMGGVETDGVTVTGRDAETGVETAIVSVSDGKVRFDEIGDGFGWYQVQIKLLQTPVGSTVNWQPVGPGGRVQLVGAPKQYAWLAPLQVVSFYELSRETNTEDHTKCAIYFPDSKQFYVNQNGNTSSVWLAVNNPASTGSNPEEIVEIANASIPGIFPLTASGIFGSPDSVSQFYDVSYTAVGTKTDHFYVKIDLQTKDRNVTPIVDGYALRVVDI